MLFLSWFPSFTGSLDRQKASSRPQRLRHCGYFGISSLSHLRAHSLSRPHHASQTPPKAGWPGQVEGVALIKPRFPSWRLPGPSSRLLPGDAGMWPELPLPQFVLTAVLDFDVRKISLAKVVEGSPPKGRDFRTLLLLTHWLLHEMGKFRVHLDQTCFGPSGLCS